MNGTSSYEKERSVPPPSMGLSLITPKKLIDKRGEFILRHGGFLHIECSLFESP
ncbi:uncharacterized protein PHALS_10799 [Plasmopara halstedii]|uniref:Uncharacterized protein n=1 Tax=Plasmopara halstedii TaxID=4781 RepID=A0A0P1AIN2_PLAHL|nr:uncharacterized protein PHALS_10799 [Plasmopara halstedii]CEG40613.1 hypothetical protein PHALS_10799 [Plasmopara halstedii]|eukprot:XP_024576982.1 hypothetical protein PHALS_10799 [Plasmopara halstedii]